MATELEKIGERYVWKSNDLIQKSRFQLSLNEQKTIAYICTMLTKTNDEKNPYQLKYEFNVSEYVDICNLEKSGKTYQLIKDTLYKLRFKGYQVEIGDDKDERKRHWMAVGWLTGAEIKPGGIVKITVDEKIINYLFDLKLNFTTFQLKHILSMKSAFSVRLYELLKSWSGSGSVTYSLDELKEIFDVTEVKSYSRFPDFRRRVIEKAVEEINIYTDLVVSWEPIKKGRSIQSIKFSISKKEIQKKIVEKKVVKKPSNNKFNNFEQRTYDMDRLEEELFGQMDISELESGKFMPGEK